MANIADLLSQSADLRPDHVAVKVDEDQIIYAELDRAAGRVAGLLRKESAALIAYRTKHGPCKTLEDLKKIPGVDFRKIERRRDRLVCI